MFSQENWICNWGSCKRSSIANVLPLKIRKNTKVSWHPRNERLSGSIQELLSLYKISAKWNFRQLIIFEKFCSKVSRHNMTFDGFLLNKFYAISDSVSKRLGIEWRRKWYLGLLKPELMTYHSRLFQFEWLHWIEEKLE